MNSKDTQTKRSEEENTGNLPKVVRSKNWPVGDIMISLFFITFAVLMFIGALNFTSRARMGRITSPKFTPILLSILVVIFCITLIVITVKRYKGISISGWSKELIHDESMQRSFILIGIMTLYIILIGIIDFLMVNLLYFLGIYAYLKIGGWARIILYGVVSTLVVVIIVPYIFNMPTP